MSYFSDRMAAGFARAHGVAGQSVTYTPIAGAAGTIDAVFSEAITAPDYDNDSRSIVRRGTLTALAADCPAPQVGDAFTISGTTWNVAEFKRGSGGVIEFILRRLVQDYRGAGAMAGAL